MKSTIFSPIGVFQFGGWSLHFMAKGSLPAQSHTGFFFQPDQAHGLIDKAIFHTWVLNELLSKTAPFGPAAESFAAEDTGYKEGLMVVVIRRTGQIQLTDALPALHRGRGDLLTRETREFS